MPEIITRERDSTAFDALVASGIDPRMARIYAAREVRSTQDLDTTFAALLKPDQLLHIDKAATLLADAIQANRRLLIVADYDADGATACAVGMKALSQMGAKVDYIVPNRFEFGYGLTPEIVALAAQTSPDIIITVDNGIASVEGVAEANRRGIEVLVTDHHLPGETLPDARVILNPNQHADAFESKHLAGVGVIFYLMLKLRAVLRDRGAFEGKFEPNLSDLLDLVALGTVADVVRLDRNNRILVEQGLQRIRVGRGSLGIQALLRVSGRDATRASTYDLGFMVGPRINAAGRLDDMSLGIACLLADTELKAMTSAGKLDALNRERRTIEADMRDTAFNALGEMDVTNRYTLSLFDPDWHQGVVGILAGRVREKTHRPVIAFARDGTGNLRGSGRSIAGFHMRDALDLVTKRRPQLIDKFGGHAMAAGLTIREAAFPDFTMAFEAVSRELLSPAALAERIETDGALAPDELDLAFADTLEARVWGQGFPAPTFMGQLKVLEQRIVGEKHLKLKVSLGGTSFEAMRFGSADRLNPSIDAVFRPSVNVYRGEKTLQLLLDHTA